MDLVNELESQKVHFQSITDGVDTKTPAGRFFFHVMASLAQMERELGFSVSGLLVQLIEIAVFAPLILFGLSRGGSVLSKKDGT